MKHDFKVGDRIAVRDGDDRARATRVIERVTTRFVVDSKGQKWGYTGRPYPRGTHSYREPRILPVYDEHLQELRKAVLVKSIFGRFRLNSLPIAKLEAILKIMEG